MQVKKWFFEVTGDAVKRGTRYLTKDRVSEETLREHIESSVFKSESEDKAKIDTGVFNAENNGHVVMATGAQAKAFQAQPSNRTLAAGPENLTELSVVEQEIDGVSMNAINLTKDNSKTTRNAYQISLSQTFVDNYEENINEGGSSETKGRIYVDSAADIPSGNGTVGNPFKTLDEAVALYDGEYSGSTPWVVRVNGGIYTPSSNLYRPNLHFVFEGAAEIQDSNMPDGDYIFDVAEEASIFRVYGYPKFRIIRSGGILRNVESSIPQFGNVEVFEVDSISENVDSGLPLFDIRSGVVAVIFKQLGLRLKDQQSWNVRRDYFYVDGGNLTIIGATYDNDNGLQFPSTDKYFVRVEKGNLEMYDFFFRGSKTPIYIKEANILTFHNIKGEALADLSFIEFSGLYGNTTGPGAPNRFDCVILDCTNSGTFNPVFDGSAGSTIGRRDEIHLTNSYFIGSEHASGVVFSGPLNKNDVTEM